jgi:hypothetical protein
MKTCERTSCARCSLAIRTPKRDNVCVATTQMVGRDAAYADDTFVAYLHFVTY